MVSISMPGHDFTCMELVFFLKAWHEKKVFKTDPKITRLCNRTRFGPTLKMSYNYAKNNKDTKPDFKPNRNT